MKIVVNVVDDFAILISYFKNYLLKFVKLP